MLPVCSARTAVAGGSQFRRKSVAVLASPERWAVISSAPPVPSSKRWCAQTRSPERAPRVTDTRSPAGASTGNTAGSVGASSATRAGHAVVPSGANQRCSAVNPGPGAANKTAAVTPTATSPAASQRRVGTGLTKAPK